jgi:hypothetical protein
LNKDFGIYVQRPFYVVSDLPQHRYLDIKDNTFLVINKPNGQSTKDFNDNAYKNKQVWWFDQNTLTIKTTWNRRSWNVFHNGARKEMEIMSTNDIYF